MREIERDLRARGLGSLLSEFEHVPPSQWADALELVWLDGQLEPARPNFARFDGRSHDNVVAEFVQLEAGLREISYRRVLRAAGEAYIATVRERRDQDAAVRIQIEKSRPRKPLRELFTEATDVMLRLAPCVMASPLSISQFLPRATIFDVVVFDEGSQITPESAVTAIMRGSRVVVAGDDRQLPPTDFFRSMVAEDDELEEDALSGTESVLSALRPFAKPLGLRVHYRSHDERLIAFSNHHIYGNELVTFPGSGQNAQGVRFELVTPSGSQIDEDSSSPEVERVVDLIVEHAEMRVSAGRKLTRLPSESPV
jgi:hypothetical protein